MKKLACFPVLLLLTHILFAQMTVGPDWRPMDTSAAKGNKDFMLALQVGIPSAEMRPAIRNQMGNIGFGGELLFLSDPASWGKTKGEGALRIGGALGYTYYGRFKTNVEIGGYEGHYKTSYGIFDLKAIVRFRPRLNRGISPFADLQAGGDFYLSSTSEDLNAIETALGLEPIQLESTASAGFSKGLGGGFVVGSGDPEQGKFVVRVMYNWGTRVKYIVRNSMEYDPEENTLTYQMGKAPLRYISIQVGVGL